MLALKTIARREIRRASGLIFPRVKVKPGVRYQILGTDGHCFVGYYDVNPVSGDGQSILCQKVPKNETRRSEPRFAEIGLIEIESNHFEPLTVSSAVNWQLGTRVQWINDYQFVYNDIENGLHLSRLFDLKEHKSVRNFKRPYWAISPDRKLGASLNFSRILKHRPGYGYSAQSPDGDKEILSVFDLKTGQTKLEVSLDQILSEVGFKKPASSDPYLNHVTWSPCSTKFLTLFHFDGYPFRSREIYPVLVDLRTEKIEMFYKGGHMSHHVWLSENELLSYLTLNSERCFALWSSKDGWTALKDRMPLQDGHPHPLPHDPSKVVVDSYPDRSGRMHLYISDLRQDKAPEKLASVFSPVVYTKELRCDLHPRVSADGSMIICDFPDFNGRRILVLHVEYS